MYGADGNDLVRPGLPWFLGGRVGVDRGSPVVEVFAPDEKIEAAGGPARTAEVSVVPVGPYP